MKTWQPFVMALLGILAGCSIAASGGEVERPSTKQELPVITSIVNLLVDPDHYEGRIVTVSGILSVEHEDFSLYRDTESYDFVRASDSIFLSLDEDQVARLQSWQGEYVVVTGRFVKRDFWGSSPGELTNIERVDQPVKRKRRK